MQMALWRGSFRFERCMIHLINILTDSMSTATSPAISPNAPSPSSCLELPYHLSHQFGNRALICFSIVANRAWFNSNYSAFCLSSRIEFFELHLKSCFSLKKGSYINQINKSRPFFIFRQFKLNNIIFCKRRFIIGTAIIQKNPRTASYGSIYR